MTFKEWVFNRLGVVQMNRLPSLLERAIVQRRIEGQQMNDAFQWGLNNGATLYPAHDRNFQINEGYNKNAWVYSIVSKCSKKFSQVPWYHYRIKNKERKTWFDEYIPLTKDRISDPLARLEAIKMRKKAIDQIPVDSKLSELLSKPNPNQSGAQFREQLYGYKLLNGEGNIWFSRDDKNDAPKSMYLIPKHCLALVKGASPWTIDKYRLLISGREFENPKENILMWISPNYEFNETTLSHLRGLSPLNAGALILQSSNEGAEKIINMNKNQGVAGLAYRKDKHDTPDHKSAMFQRQQFNSIVNDKELEGTIGVMNGDWGYIQFGLDANQLRLLEQSDVHFKGLCNVFDVPWQLFGNSDSYENRRQYKRDFIYDNIAVACYSLRDELNAKLIREFNLDRERDVIDCDVMALPELTNDLKEQVATLKDAHGLSIDQRLISMGYDPIGGAEGEARLVPSGYTTLKDIVDPLGGSNEADSALLD